MPVEQDDETQRRLEEAVACGFLSAPQAVDLPVGFPFYVATCAVDLPEGCLSPPGGLARRLGVGRGCSAAEAAYLALLEGVERFSLQYRSDMAVERWPLATAGGAAEPVPVAALALGAPGGSVPSTSRGAAAGADLEGAARRAVLELLEHQRCGWPLAPDAGFRRVDPAGIGRAAALAAWLEDRYRVLDLRLARHGGRHFVALASSSDRDGGRRCEGAAAGLTLFDTLVHAAEEAVFHWRNMVALDYFGTSAAAMTPEDRAEVARYRGAAEQLSWPPMAEPWRVDADLVLETTTSELMDELADASGQRVRLFDLTHPEIGVPVVKAFIG